MMMIPMIDRNEGTLTLGGVSNICNSFLASSLVHTQGVLAVRTGVCNLEYVISFKTEQAGLNTRLRHLACTARIS